MSGSDKTENSEVFYHVMNRAAAYQNIFHDVAYFEIFLELLEDIFINYQAKVYAYCLMNNHYHLLMKIDPANLSEAMRHINGLFARRYNSLQDREGPLFRGRYKAIPLLDQSYLLQLSRYIHLNPVAAKLCQRPENYLWSSYQYYLQPERGPKWLFSEPVLDYFESCFTSCFESTHFDSPESPNRIEHYKQFVLSGIRPDLKILSMKEKKILALCRAESKKLSEQTGFSDPKEYRDNKEKEYVEEQREGIKAEGSEDLTCLENFERPESSAGLEYFERLQHSERLESLKSVAQENTNLSKETQDIPETKRMTEKYKIALAQKIIDMIAQYYHIDPATIYMSRYKTAANYPRKIIIYLLSQYFNIERDVIVNIMQGISKTGVSKVCQRIKAKMENDERFLSEMNRIRKFLLEQGYPALYK